MIDTRSQSDRSKEVFDRILGRRGDAARLEPAIKVIVKYLPKRMEENLHKSGFDLSVESGDHRQVGAGGLFEKHKKGAACVLLGTETVKAVAYLICDHPAAGVITEAMLGGDPEFSTLPRHRAPTAMERDLIRQFADITGQALQAALATAECPKSVRMATSAEDVRENGIADAVVAFDLTLGFGAARPVVTIAVDHSFLLQMSRPAAETIRKPVTARRGSANRNALSVKVPVTGSVTLPAMTLRELGSLRSGDVLPLSESADATVRLKVKGRPIYECGLGRKGSNYALCLERPHRAMTEVLNGIALPMFNPDLEETYDD